VGTLQLKLIIKSKKRLVPKNQRKDEKRGGGGWRKTNQKQKLNDPRDLQRKYLERKHNQKISLNRQVDFPDMVYK
jgi:hypothetical protein